MKKGFTLIELLVIVLIIVVPSSIALPKYTKAVEKARATEALVQMDALTQAIDVYILRKGFFKNNDYLGKTYFKQLLDIDISDSENLNTDYDCMYSFCRVFISKKEGDWPLAATLYRDAEEWQKSCSFSNRKGKAVCDMFKGQGFSEHGSY